MLEGSTKTSEISIILTMDHVETSVNLLLEDLLAQTHKQFEVIVVDLSSTDQSRAIFENYRDKLGLHITQLDG